LHDENAAIEKLSLADLLDLSAGAGADFRDIHDDQIGGVHQQSNDPLPPVV
jgi:hypothetical protein